MRRYWLIAIAVLAYSFNGYGEQYRSRELAAPTSSATDNKQSVAQLEAQLQQIDDAYSHASTARFLARHYMQEGGKADLEKAVRFYKEALKDKGTDEGLSRYAKQETVIELANIYFYQKDYGGFLRAVQLFESYGGKLDQSQQIKQARALYEQGKKDQALASTRAVYKALKPRLHLAESSVLQQLRFLFYQLQRYDAAAVVQRQILSRENTLAQWQRLSQIYRKAKKPGKAAESLLLAHKKNLVLPTQDLELITELLMQAKNPFAAATQLQDFMDTAVLPASVKHYESLFYYWYQAQETDKAIAALTEASRLKPEVSRFLSLAELHRTQQQWQKMQANVLKACAGDLDDEYVSRANLYLGISELKLGNKASARQAFINATLIGGRGDAAIQYLQFMRAPEPTEKELNSFYGPCKPRWANSGSDELTLAGMVGFSVQKQQGEKIPQQTLEFTVKTLEPQRFVVGQYTLSVAAMEKKLLPLAMKLGVYTMTHGGKINGPMHFNFPEPVAEGATEINFQMAFPIGKAPRLTGRYKLVDEAEFYTASMTFDGPPEQLVETWKAFYFAVVAKGHSPTGRSRQVVIDPEKSSRDRIHLELQMQLNKPVN